MFLIQQLVRKSLFAILLLAIPVCLSAQVEDLVGPNAPDPDMVEEIIFREDTTDQILNLLERLTGRAVIRPQALPAATFTFNSQQPMTRDEAILALYSLLSINGIGVSPMGDLFLKVVPLARVRSEAPQFLETSTLNLPASGRIVSRMLSLDFLSIEDLQTQLGLMITPGSGSIIPFPKANSLLITDTVANLQSIERLLAEVDEPTEPSVVTKFYQIEYARAPDLVAQIQAFAGAEGVPELSARTTITADERSNQVILVADSRQVPYFERLIEKLDVPAEIVTHNEVIFLKHANAPEVASLLSQLASGSSGGGSSSTGSSRSGSSRVRSGLSTGGSDSSNSLGGRSSRSSRSNDRNDSRRSGVPEIPGRTRAQSADVSALQTDGDAIDVGGDVVPDGPEAVVSELVRSASNSDFSESLSIVPDERSNAIVVSGTRRDIALITSLIEKIDIVLAQVRIEVFIAEVTLNEGDGYGIEEFGFTYTEGTDQLDFNLAGPGYAISRTDLTWNAALTAAETNSDIKVLSVPTIVTTHNKEASIIVAESRPIITGTITGGSINSDSIRSQVNYEDIGIELFVLPLIGKDGTIQLEIEQNVDDVVGEILIDGNEQPIIGRRQAVSFVSVSDGDTIVLGGLQSTRKTKSSGRLGILGQIPIIGGLFGSYNSEETRTELLVFIRPTVLPNPAVAHEDAQRQISKLSAEHNIQAELHPETTEEILPEGAEEISPEPVEEDESPWLMPRLDD